MALTQQQIDEMMKKARAIQERVQKEVVPQVETLKKAKKAGMEITPMEITPKTTIEKARKVTELTERAGEIRTGLERARSMLADIKAQNIKEIGLEEPPAIPVDTGAVTAAGIGAATAGKGTIDDLQKRIEALEKFEPSAELKEEKKSILDLIKKRETTAKERKSAVELREEALAQAYKEMGVTPEQIQRIGGLIGEVTEFNKQIADLEAQKQAALDMAEERGMPMTYIRGEQARKEKEYNSKISAKALQAGVKVQELQMLQGAYTDAKATASQIVSLATYDQQQKVADIEWSISAHQDLYDLMSKEEQTAWNRQYATAKDELDRQTKEWSDKTDLVIDAARRGIKLDINKSLEDLTEDYTREVAALPEEAEVPITRTIGGVLYEWDKATGIWKETIRPPEVEFRKFTDQEKRKLEQAGIDWTIPTGYQQSLEYLYGTAVTEEAWTSTENYIVRNIQTGATSPEDMATIYATTKQNTKLTDSDIKAIMAQYGMVNMYGMWFFMGTAPTEGEALPTEEVAEEEQPWWRRAASEVWHRLPFIK